MHLEDHFPEISDKMEHYLEVYWIDLRRQIRDQLGADEAEQLIDNATEGISNGKLDN